MDRGLYSASSGGFLATRRLDIVANNLANINTVGYKAERLIARKQEFGDTLAATMPGRELRRGDFERTPGVIVEGTATDFTNGPIQYTGDPLHVALTDPKQFFTVTTPQGELLTRAGNFTKNSEGQLVTADGMPVSGAGGPITMPPGIAKISPNGTITVNGRNVGKVRVVQVQDTTALERIGSTRFKLQSGTAEELETPYLAAESVEMPNIQVVDGMIDMINASKAFEAYTKTAQTINELNDRAIRNTRSTG